MAYAVAAATFKEWSVYRTHTMVSILVGPVYFAVQYFIWTAVYTSRDTLAGMELPAIIRYFGATALIGYLTMDFADWNLSMLVRTGKFLTFSLRPVHHRYFALAQKLGHRVLGLGLEFIPCIVIFHFVFGVDMRPAHAGWALLSVALAFFINFQFNYILGLTSFWFVKAEGVRRVIYLTSMFFSGALIPLTFFPQRLQTAQYFLPFQYTVYVPAMVYVGNFDLNMIVCQILAACVIFIAGERVYRRAMRRYCDVGA